MKNLSLFILGAMLLFACKQSVPVEDVQELVLAENSSLVSNHLHGMVHTISESSYTPDSLGVFGEMDSCCAELNTYNKEGFIESSKDMDRDGNLVSETMIKFNDKGRFLSAVTVENGVQVWSRTSVLDENGMVIHGYDKDSTDQITYYYNDMVLNEIGQPLEGKSYFADSTYRGFWTRAYTDGMETERGWRDSTDIEVFKEVSTLNDQGFIAQTTSMNIEENDTTNTVETFLYDSFDESGNWTQRTIFEDGKATKMEKRSYTYYTEE